MMVNQIQNFVVNKNYNDSIENYKDLVAQVS